VLRHVYQDQRLRDPFIGTLPRAGVDGTLGERMKGTAAADNVRAKTGSFSNARSVAGYVRTADGEPLEFVVMANNYGAPPKVIDDATDAILVSLARFSRR
jgi:D-alanyl-D-alanine carboxypeptidase